MQSDTGSGTSRTLGELHVLADLVSVERLERMPRSAMVEALLRQRARGGGTSGEASATSSGKTAAPRWHSAV